MHDYVSCHSSCCCSSLSYTCLSVSSAECLSSFVKYCLFVCVESCMLVAPCLVPPVCLCRVLHACCLLSSPAFLMSTAWYCLRHRCRPPPARSHYRRTLTTVVAGGTLTVGLKPDQAPSTNPHLLKWPRQPRLEERAPASTWGDSTTAWGVGA